MMLRIVLFGVPQLRLETTDLSKIITGRSLALLVYLAVTGKAQDRNILADILWDNLSEAQAKKNLRYVLYDLRQAIGDYLIVSRQTIAFNRKGQSWLDVEIFSSYLRTDGPKINVELYQEILDLYQGDFLSGFYIQDAPIFEEWLMTRRQQFHAQAIQGLHLLAQAYLDQRQYDLGLLITQRLLAMEPWNEEAHRQQMRFLVNSGRRSAALAQYEACRRALTAEYNAEPLIETTQLYEEIKAGRFSKLPEKKREPGSAFRNIALPFTALPTQPNEVAASQYATPPSAIQVNWDAIPIPPQFQGRTQELARLEQWICHDGCRLLSIHGLGGQGKSALVAEAVRRLADHAEEQWSTVPRRRSAQTNVAPQELGLIFWCSLAGVSSFTQLIAYWWRWSGAMAGLTELEWLEKDTPLEEQLAYLLLYLRQQRCLLVFDQVEQILQPGVLAGAYTPGWEHFSELLRRVAESEHQSCVVLISREELPVLTYLARNTSAVRLLTLQGLATPDSIAIMRSHGCVGEETLLAELAQQYAGLPLALTCVSAMYQRFPTVQLSTLLLRDLHLFDELHNLFAQQFKRLSFLEYELLLWLALEQTAVSFDYFWQTFGGSGAKGQILDAHQSLLRRSLLQVEIESQNFRLPTLVSCYATAHLIDLLVAELMIAWQIFVQSPTASSPARILSSEAVRPLLRSVHYRHLGVTERCELPFALYSGQGKGHQVLPPFPKAEPVVPHVMEKESIVERSSPSFPFLQCYRLIKPGGSDRRAELQNNSILFPLINALHKRWGVRATRKRLQELLAALQQDFDHDISIVEDNVRQLLACLEFTETVL